MGDVRDVTADRDRMWVDVDAAMLHAERRALLDDVFGPDRSAGWDDEDEYRDEAA